MRPIFLLLILLPLLLPASSFARPTPVMVGEGWGYVQYGPAGTSCSLTLVATLVPEDGGATLHVDALTLDTSEDAAGCQDAAAGASRTYAGLQGSTRQGYSSSGFEQDCYVSVDLTSIRMVSRHYSFTTLSISVSCGSEWWQLGGQLEFAPYALPATRLLEHKPGVGEGRIAYGETVWPTGVHRQHICEGSAITVNVLDGGDETMVVVTGHAQTGSGSQCAGFEGWTEIIEHATGSRSTGYTAYYTPDGVCKVRLTLGPLGPATSLDLEHHCSPYLDIVATVAFDNVV